MLQQLRRQRSFHFLINFQLRNIIAPDSRLDLFELDPVALALALYALALGMPTSSKTDEFSEKFQRGGSFSIQKFILQIFAIIDDTSVMNFRKNLQHNFPKMRGGGSKAVWNFSENSFVLVALGFP